MDRQLAERMVGAACLLAVLVLVVPALLDGNPESDAPIPSPVDDETLDLRTHTIRLDGAEREPPIPIPRHVAPVPEPSAEPEPKPHLKPEPKLEIKPEPLATSDPVLVAPAKQTAAKKPLAAEPPVPSKAAASVDAGGWIVQLGSFSRRDNAERLAADVKSKGFGVAVQGGGGADGALFRVRAGPAPDREAAETLARRLAAAGFAGGSVGRQ